MLCPDIDDDKWVNLLLQKLSGELEIFMCYSWGRDTSSGSGSDIWAERPGPWGVEIKEIWNSQTPSPAMNRMGWALRTLLVADNSSCLKDRKVSWVVRDMWVNFFVMLIILESLLYSGLRQAYPQVRPRHRARRLAGQPLTHRPHPRPGGGHVAGSRRGRSSRTR